MASLLFQAFHAFSLFFAQTNSNISVTVKECLSKE